MKNYSKFCKLIALAGALPFIYGCGSGGGTSALLSFLGLGGVGSGTVGLLSETFAETAFTAGAATELASLHQPEPASMLLLGGGLAAMTYFRSRGNRPRK